jgi:hypothetical protein
MDARLQELQKRAEAYRRDPEFSRHLNARVVPITLKRFERGTDSIEALRTRVKEITARPESEPHTIWNAQNFLEQVGAAMEAKDG